MRSDFGKINRRVWRKLLLLLLDHERRVCRKKCNVLFRTRDISRGSGVAQELRGNRNLDDHGIRFGVVGTCSGCCEQNKRDEKRERGRENGRGFYHICIGSPVKRSREDNKGRML